MVHLIDKSAVVAEIEKIIADETESIKSFEHSKNVSEVQRSNARIGVLMHLRSLLNSLGVKEVDYRPIDKDFERDAVNFCIDNGLNTTPRIAKTIAKYFFELGLFANNPITAADRGTAEEIIINLKRVEQDYRIDLTKEIKWVQNKVQKGE